MEMKGIHWTAASTSTVAGIALRASQEGVRKG